MAIAVGIITIMTCYRSGNNQDLDLDEFVFLAYPISDRVNVSCCQVCVLYVRVTVLVVTGLPVTRW